MSTATEPKKQVEVIDNFKGKKLLVDAPPDFAHPVTLGQLVYWYVGGNRNVAPRPAEVVAVGQTALTLMVKSVDCYGQTKIGVRHVSDEAFLDPRQVDARQTGGWDYAPRAIYGSPEDAETLRAAPDGKIIALENRVGQLETQIEELLTDPAKKLKAKVV